MGKRSRRGVTTAWVADQAPAQQAPAPTGKATGKASTLPFTRDRSMGFLRVDGHEVVATEPVIGSKNMPLGTAEQLLLDDDRTLYGCLKCDAVGTEVRSVATHNRTHSERYSPEVRRAVDRAVRRTMARAATNGTEPTAEEVTATLESGPVREELDRIAAEPEPFEPSPGRLVAAEPVVPEHAAPAFGRGVAAWQDAPEPEPGPRTIVEIAQDIAEVTYTLEALKAEMRKAVAG